MLDIVCWSIFLSGYVFSKRLEMVQNGQKFLESGDVQKGSLTSI